MTGRGVLYNQIMLNLDKIAAVVLAAGKGTRMKSDTPKVLHLLSGKPLINHTLEKLKKAGLENIFVVVGFKADRVMREVKDVGGVVFVKQTQQLGTAHAVKTALAGIGEDFEHVLVLNGDDSAFYSVETIQKFIESHLESDADLTFMTLKITREVALGRVIRDDDKKFRKVLEHDEYSESGLYSDEINCGKYLFKRSWLLENIEKVGKSKSGEYYLTDLLGIAQSEGASINIFELKDEKEWFGVNTMEDLEEANERTKASELS